MRVVLCWSFASENSGESSKRRGIVGVLRVRYIEGNMLPVK